jgi:hypothetical protein
MTRINFFATKTDLLLIFDKLQGKRKLKYVRAGKTYSSEPAVWENGMEIPSLGIATADQSVACDCFLIQEKDVPVHVASMRQRDRIQRFDVEQDANPDSILFNPGGEWTDGALIAGSITTNSKSPISQALMRSAHSAIRSCFTRVNAFWVGPEALVAFRNGKRLCYAVQSPSELDLREKVPQ